MLPAQRADNLDKVVRLKVKNGPPKQGGRFFLHLIEPKMWAREQKLFLELCACFISF